MSNPWTEILYEIKVYAYLEFNYQISILNKPIQ